jgi:multidrug efflux pump
VSLIGTFAAMLLLGFSVNTLTLFGMVLAIGIVVDDAIVVLENVERLMASEGLSPRDATVKAMQQVTRPVIAIVFVLTSVFLPVAFMGGLVGEMYRQFAITIAVSVSISGFVALTLSPMMSAQLLKGGGSEERGLTGFVNHTFDRLRSFYDRLIGWVLQGWVPVVVTLALLVSLLSAPFLMFAQRELAP